MSCFRKHPNIFTGRFSRQFFKKKFPLKKHENHLKYAKRLDEFKIQLDLTMHYIIAALQHLKKSKQTKNGKNWCLHFLLVVFDLNLTGNYLG